MSSFGDIPMVQTAKPIEKDAGAVYASAFLLSGSDDIQETNTFADELGAGQVKVLNTRALLFFEGKHVDGLGKPFSATRPRLDKIVANTNKWLLDGRRLKIYASDSDHRKISQDTTIGFIEGDLGIEEITSDNLPTGSPITLLGKMGIFAKAAIAGVENVTRYLDGRLKELSVGIAGDRIYEVSAAAIPMLPGAALFAAHDPDIFALSMGEWMEQRRKEKDMGSLYELFEGFLQVSTDVANATPEKLGGRSPDELRAIAITDLATQLRGRLGVRDTQPLTMPSPFSKELPMPDDQEKTAFALQQEKLDEERATFAREKTTFSTYTKLKSRADELVKAGRLTPAAYKQYFFDDEAAIAHFSQVDHHDELGKLDFHFSQIEKFGPAVPLDSKLKDEPIAGEKDPEKAAKEDELEAARIVAASQKFSAIF